MKKILCSQVRGGKLGSKEIEQMDTIERDGRLYYKYLVLRTKKLASAIISNQIDSIGVLKEETREVGLNADSKRFWLNRLTSISELKLNVSMSLNPQIFPKDFESNLDYNADQQDLSHTNRGASIFVEVQ